jgi:ribosome-associated translation inhibitor RaiA
MPDENRVDEEGRRFTGVADWLTRVQEDQQKRQEARIAVEHEQNMLDPEYRLNWEKRELIANYNQNYYTKAIEKAKELQELARLYDLIPAKQATEFTVCFDKSNIGGSYLCQQKLLSEIVHTRTTSYAWIKFHKKEKIIAPIGVLEFSLDKDFNFKEVKLVIPEEINTHIEKHLEEKAEQIRQFRETLEKLGCTPTIEMHTHDEDNHQTCTKKRKPKM